MIGQVGVDQSRRKHPGLRTLVGSARSWLFLAFLHHLKMVLCFCRCAHLMGFLIPSNLLLVVIIDSSCHKDSCGVGRYQHLQMAV